jgi:biofilm PGA synthesis N-glycosyltransferase PgaC
MLLKLSDSFMNAEPSTSATAAPGFRYALITPCRDEAKFARRTLDSVTQQTISPSLWLIVDDGSTDETPQILTEYAAKFPYIKVIRRENRGFRKLGGGVIDAFYEGYDRIRSEDFDYVCKFDLDLDLPRAYFQTLMEKMGQEPRIGTASGKPWFSADGKRISEKCGDENSVGMIKFYRTDCFRQIGGFVRELMWDGIDGHRCRMLGWIAVSWSDPELQFEHLRPMGTSHRNWWTGRVRHGFGQYYMGTGITYMLASAIFRIFHPPVVRGSIAMLWGYFRSLLTRAERYPDPEFRQFLRKYQWRSLVFGKERATRDLNASQTEVWVAKAKQCECGHHTAKP